MCSCLSQADRSTAPPRPWPSVLRAGLADVPLPPRALSPREMNPLQLLRPSARPVWAATELAWLAPAFRPVHGVHVDGCGHDESPWTAHRPRSVPQPGSRWVPNRAPPPEPHSLALLCGCRYRRELVRETWVEGVPVGPAPVFPVAVCAAFHGRASICACCTCNTLGALAAMSASVRTGPRNHTYVTIGIPIL